MRKIHSGLSIVADYDNQDNLVMRIIKKRSIGMIIYNFNMQVLRVVYLKTSDSKEVSAIVKALANMGFMDDLKYVSGNLLVKHCVKDRLKRGKEAYQKIQEILNDCSDDKKDCISMCDAESERA